MNDKTLLSMDEASDCLSVHPSTLRRWDNNGTLKAVRIGPRKDRRYRLKDIEKFVNKKKKQIDKKQFQLYSFHHERKVLVPLFGTGVSAGFPSPADDHIDAKLDLNDYIIKRPAATFFVKANGQSMKNAGIHDGDLLVVDRSIEVSNNKIVIAVINGELTVKRFAAKNKKYFLMPENDEYNPLEITEENDFHIWGVVTNVIHSVY